MDAYASTILRLLLFALVAGAACVAGFLMIAFLRAKRRMVHAPTVRGHQGEHSARARTRVVILGGGFAAVYTAQKLEKLLRKREDVHVVLISQENYFVFQPMLPEVISGTIGLVDIVSPLRRLLPATDVIVRQVTSIDLARKVVVTSPGFEPHAHEVPYDHLVLGLGTVTDFRGMRGMPEHARPFKNLADAVSLRNHIIRALEEAAIERNDVELTKALLTFVIAGGGFSGVEIAAELNDFVRAVGRHYRGIDSSQIKVILLHGQDRILPELDPTLARFAHEILVKRGVEIRLGQRLEAASGNEAILKGGEHIPTKTLISTVPSHPHPVIDALAVAKTKNGRVDVDPFLQVKGSDHIWAVGDCASASTTDGAAVPPTAQHATRAADIAAHNIMASIDKGSMEAFDFKGLGKMSSLGHRSAVAEVFGIKLSGFVAWWVWRTIYLAKLPGWGRRLKVATSWTLDLFLAPDLVELQLGGAAGIAREHYEAGQVVFREGDLGDRLYIVLNGAAEALKNDQVLARIGPGEFFGEMALLNDQQRNATIRCAETMDVLSLPKREFGLLTTHLPGLKTSVQGVVAKRVGGP